MEKEGKGMAGGGDLPIPPNHKLGHRENMFNENSKKVEKYNRL